MGLTQQKAADHAAVSAYNTMSPADRLKRLKRCPWAAHHIGEVGTWRGYQAAARTSAAEPERYIAIVERWNAAPTHDWSPAIGTALKAGYRWLDVYCGGRRLVKPINLAAIDIHPQACLTSLILSLRCRQCGSHGPMPQLMGLSCFPAVALSPDRDEKNFRLHRAVPPVNRRSPAVRASAVRIWVGVFPVQRLNACVKALTS
jgi:hypothetical protein